MDTDDRLAGVRLDRAAHESVQPELVVVGTPPSSHAELSIAALEGGANVICEKPFVSTVEEADRVLATAAAADRRVAVNHQYRAKPVFRAVKEQIGKPGVGRLVFCQVSQLMDLPPWDEPVPWRAAMPNRTLFEAGCHLVDLLLDLYGELPEAVYARHSSGLDQTREADAVHLVMLEFSGGRLAQITIDRLCRGGHALHRAARRLRGGVAASLARRPRAVAAGDEARRAPGIRLHYGLGGVAWAEKGPHRKKLARNPRNPGVAATVTLFREIVAAFNEGREPPASGSQARDGSARDRGRLSLGGHRSARASCSAPPFPDRQRGGGCSVSVPCGRRAQSQAVGTGLQGPAEAQGVRARLSLLLHAQDDGAAPHHLQACAWPARRACSAAWLHDRPSCGAA